MFSLKQTSADNLIASGACDELLFQALCGDISWQEFQRRITEIQEAEIVALSQRGDDSGDSMRAEARDRKAAI